jgi:hypothetical protein
VRATPLYSVTEYSLPGITNLVATDVPPCNLTVMGTGLSSRLNAGASFMIAA